MENAVFSAHAGRCLFPMRPDLQYRKTSNAERAAQHFLRYLEQKPDDLEVKWLLNIACMNTGRYPSRVPKQHLIAPTVLESKEDIGRFADVAHAAGLKIFEMAG